ncbi:hypothetical protein ABZ428_16595 [Micromonospora matsumotoense]
MDEAYGQSKSLRLWLEHRDVGNGRGARKLFGVTVVRQAERLADLPTPASEQLRLLLPGDIPPVGN